MVEMSQDGTVPDLTSYLRGAKAVPVTIASAIGIGQTITVTVNWDRTLPDTSYAVIPTVEGVSGLVGVLVAQALDTGKTTTQATIAVKNTGLISIGLNATVNALAVYAS